MYINKTIQKTVQTIQNIIIQVHLLPNTYALQKPHIHTHTLQNKIKQQEYKLTQTRYKTHRNKIVTI